MLARSASIRFSLLPLPASNLLMNVTKPLALLLLAAPLAAHAQLPAGTTDTTVHEVQSPTSQRVAAAEKALEAGDTKSAQRDLAILATERPADPRIQYDLGFAAEGNDDAPTARKAYEAAIAAAPGMIEPRVALGLLDVRTGVDVDRGVGELRHAATVTSADPALRARALRALAVLDQPTQPAQAGDELAQAIKLTGEKPQDVTLGADMASKAGDLPDAESAYRRALAQPGDHTEAALGLAHNLLVQHRAEEAVAVLSDNIVKDPANLRMADDNLQLTAALASAQVAAGRPNAGIDALVHLRDTNPAAAADPAITRELADLYAANGDTAHAGPMLQQLLTDQPGDPRLLDSYGSVLVREQQYAEAQRVLALAASKRTSFHNDGDWAETEGHLAFAASKNHDPQGVLQALVARATVEPNSPASLFLSATAHDTLHQYRQAGDDYRAFLALAGKDSAYSNESFEARHRLVALQHMH